MKVHTDLERAIARNRYQRAVELIRAIDQHRAVASVGLNTYTDARNVAEAFYNYRRTRAS